MIPKQKLSGAALNYPTYDKKLYAVVRTLQTTQNQFSPRKFIIGSDHETLWFFKSQGKLNKRHAEGPEFMDTFCSVLKQKKSQENVVTGALSRSYTLLTSLQTKVLGFELLKTLEAQDFDYDQVWNACERCAIGVVYRHEGF